MKKLKMATPDRVLKLLLKGATIRIEDEEYVFDENYDLCVRRRKFKAGEDWKNENGGEEVLLKAFMDLKDFIHLCAKMKDDDYFLTCGDITLQEINKQGGTSSRIVGKKHRGDESYILPDTFYSNEEVVQEFDI